MPDRANSPYKAIYIDVAPGRNHVHTNGGPVRGRVRVDPSKRPQRVSISFKGREKCSITRKTGNSSTTYREKPEYFAHELELFSSATRDASYDIVNHGITQDNRVDLPFEFTFPEATQIQQQPPSKWRESEQFLSHGGQLPPSYLYYGSFSTDEQIVEYYLEARLYTESRYNASVEVRQAIIFRPQYFQPPNPIPMIQKPRFASQRSTCIRTHKIHPDYNPDEGFKDRMKHRWTKHKQTTPYATFQLEAVCPSIVTLRMPVQLTLSLTHMDRSPDIPTPPPVFLRRVLVRVESRILIRVPYESFFSGPEFNDSHDDKAVLLDRAFNEGDGLLLYDGMSVTTGKWPDQLSPPFKSYGLNLEHTMHVKVWGECGGEKFEMRVVCGKLMGVVTRGTASRRESAVTRGEAAGEGELMPPPPVEEDVAPPPYQVLGKS